MKKLLSVIAALAIFCACAFGLSACGENGKDGADGKDGVDGINGKDGVSVESAYFDDDGNLIIKLTDGKEVNCGQVKAPEGENFYYTAVEKDGAIVSYTLRNIGSVSSAEIVIPATYRGKPVAAIGDSAFFQSKYITSVTIPDSVKSIGNYAFEGCENLKTVDLGNGVETIGDSAFAYCWALEKIAIPSSVRTIGSSVFCDCYNLAEATFEEGVERIGSSIFTGCNMLEEVILPDSIDPEEVVNGGDYSMFATFMNCMNLRYVKLPETLEFLPQRFFSGCSSLQKVDFGKSLNNVGYAAFYNNASLTSLVLPASLRRCERYGFYRLDALESVYFEGTAEQWESIEIHRADSTTDMGSFSLSPESRANNDLFADTVTIYFYSEAQPAEAGDFWRYVDGTPTKW